MDGGGITIDNSNVVNTTWQRKGEIYYAQPGKPETHIANGRYSSISGTGPNTVLAFQNNDTVKLVSLKNKSAIVVGNGGFLKSASLSDNKILCVWEQDNKIKFRKI